MTDVHISDGRDDLPIFIHSELDDLDITPEAFRVYAHLARRAGKDNDAWPSYASIGERCFRKRYPNAASDTLRRKAMAAVKELLELGLIVRQHRKKGEEHTSNSYSLTPRREWRGGVTALRGVTASGSVTAPRGVTASGGVTTPKGSASKGSASKGSASKGSAVKGSQKEDHPSSSADNDDDDSGWKAAIHAKLRDVGVRITPFVVKHYRDMANDYGIEAVLRGITAAAENDKASNTKYVDKCILTAAQSHSNKTPVDDYSDIIIG